MFSIIRRARPALLAIAATAACAAHRPVSPRDAQLEDIAYIERNYIPREQAFTPESRARAQRLAAALRERAGTLTPEQLFLGLAEIVATADNAHSTLGYGSADASPQFVLPLKMAAMDDAGWLILRAAPPEAGLAGGVVTHVDGMPVTQVMDRVAHYFGGLRARREILGMGLVGSRGMLHAMGLARRPDRLLLTVRDASGQSREHDVAFVPRSTVGGAYWPHRWWSPEPIAGDTTPWATAVPAQDAPFYLRNAERNFQVARIAELDALYLQMWTNEAERGVDAFVQEAGRALDDRPARNLIVDLRFNKGGDLSLTAALLRSLPARIPPEGRIYVITGRYTISAGIVAAAIIKRAGGDRVTLVGEPVGDRLRFWSEGDTACAPNSHLCARYTDGYFDAVDGCVGESGCFRENRRWEFVVGNLDLDLPAPMTTAAYLSRRDPAMEAIAADLRRRAGAATH